MESRELEAMSRDQLVAEVQQLRNQIVQLEVAQQHSQPWIELEVLHRAVLKLISSLDLPEVLESVLEATVHLLPAIRATHIFLYDGNTLTFGAARMPDGLSSTPISEPRCNGLTYTVARSGKMIVVEDMRNHPLFQDTPTTWRGTIIGLPLAVREQVVGVMNVAYDTYRPLGARELRVLRVLADQAAIAIENARLHQLVSAQARTDVLTDLPNRRALNEQLVREIERSQRRNSEFALLLLDLDGFKQVNDTLGHPRGDALLREVGRLLRNRTREGDLVARYGGDEFAILLPGASPHATQQIARNLSLQVATLTPHSDLCDLPTLSFSCGTAFFPSDGTTGDELLQVADVRLYQIKRDRYHPPRAATAPLRRLTTPFVLAHAH